MTSMAAGEPVVGGGFSPKQELALHTVTGIGAGVSLVALLFVVLSYVIFPNLRKPTTRLVVWLSVADVCNAFAYFIGYGGGHGLCVAQAVAMQFFGIASMLWSGAFAYHLVVVLAWRDPNDGRFERYYHTLCWGVALLFTAIPWGAGTFGPTPLWCWIGAAHASYRFGVYYGPFLLLFVAQAICFVRVSQALAGDPSAADVNRRLILYLCCFGGVRLWGLLNRAQNASHPTEPVLALYALHALFSPLQGVFNALVYGFNKRLRDHYRLVCSAQPHSVVAIDGALATAATPAMVGVSDGLLSPALSSSDADADAVPQRPLQPDQELGHAHL